MLNKIKFAFISSLIERIVYFIIYVLIARFYSQQEYGIIISIVSLVNIIGIILDLGLNVYIQREFAHSNNSLKKLNLIILIKIITLPFYILMPVIYLLIIGNKDLILVIVISFSQFVISLTQVINSALQGLNEFKKSYKIILISRTLTIFIFIILVFINAGINYLFFPFILGSLFQIYLLKKVLPFTIFKLSEYKLTKTVIVEIFKSSIPMGLSLIFVMIYDRIDILLIERFLDLKSVAIYSAAYSLFRTAQIFSSSILMPYFNKFSLTFNNKMTIFLTDIKNAFVILISISLILILFFNLFSKIIIQILYTEKYIESIDVLSLLSFALPGVFLNNLTGVIANSIRKEKIPSLSTGISALFNIVLNILLIPLIGIKGAIITTIITEYFVFFVQLFLLSKFKFSGGFKLE